MGANLCRMQKQRQVNYKGIGMAGHTDYNIGDKADYATDDRDGRSAVIQFPG